MPVLKFSNAFTWAEDEACHDWIGQLSLNGRVYGEIKSLLVTRKAALPEIKFIIIINFNLLLVLLLVS